jgi:hypothetical protein
VSRARYGWQTGFSEQKATCVVDSGRYYGRRHVSYFGFESMHGVGYVRADFQELDR